MFTLNNQPKRPLTKALILTTLTLLCSANASASTCIWTGASSALWSVAGNWSGCGGNAPINGDSLQFPELAANKSSNHDLATLTSVAGLDFNGSSSGYALSGNALSLGAGGISNSNTSGSNALALNLSLAVAMSFSGNTGAMNLNGSLDLGGQDLTIAWPATSGALVPWTLNGVISGSGSITANGADANDGLVLAGNNSFSGLLSLNGGDTLLANPNAAGLADGSTANGISVGSAATLLLGPGTSYGNESLTLAAGAGESGNGMVQPDGSNAWGGPVQLLGGGLGSSSFHGLAGDALNLTGVISGPGGFDFGSAPAVIYQLSNPGNTFSGGVITNAIPAGATLQLGGDNAIPSTSAVVLQGSASFDLNGFDDNIAALSCTATDQVIIPFGSSLFVGGSNANTTCAGVIAGVFNNAPFTALTKIGSGTLTLTGTSTFPGEVDVLGGGLEVDGSLIADPATAMFVSSGQNASLFGTGTVGNVVTAGNIHGGTLSTPGTLTINFLSFNGVGNLSARIAGTASFDQINVSNLNLATSPVLTVTLSFVPVPGTIFTLINNNGNLGAGGTFSGLAEGASLVVNGIPFTISYVGGTGNDVTLTAGGGAPAPSVAYSPATGVPVTLSATGTGNIDAVASDFIATSAVTISGCAFAPASPAFPGSAFTITNPSFAAPNGSIAIACLPQSTAIAGTISCNEAFVGGVGSVPRSWPTLCPALPLALPATSIPLLPQLGKLLLISLLLGFGALATNHRQTGV